MSLTIQSYLIKYVAHQANITFSLLISLYYFLAQKYLQSSSRNRREKKMHKLILTLLVLHICIKAIFIKFIILERIGYCNEVYSQNHLALIT